jgi:hypothetical protein
MDFTRNLGNTNIDVLVFVVWPFIGLAIPEVRNVILDAGILW